MYKINASTVLIVETHTAVRDAFAGMIDLHDTLRVVGTAGTPQQALDLASEYHPELALINIQLSSDYDHSLLRALRSALPDCRILLMSDRDLPQYYGLAYENSAWGYVHKDLPFHDIIHALDQVASGHKLLTKPQPSHEWKSPLTSRETFVLEAVSRVGSTAAIAQETGLAPGTINNYISQVIAKLDTTSRLGAVIIAREQGWI
jgi:two-component system response regulator DesR